MPPGPLGGDQGVLQKLNIDAAAEVRIDPPPDLRATPAVVGLLRLGQLVQDRQAGQVQQAVPHLPGDRQLGLEDPARRRLGLGGDLDQEAVGPRRQGAPDLHENVGRIAAGGEDVGLIDQDPRRLRPGDDVGIGGLDLQLGPGRPVDDGLHVPAQVEELQQLGVGLDDPLGLAIADPGDFLGRGNQQVFGVRPAVHDHRRDHDRGGVGRLSVLLGDQEEKLLDHSAVHLGVVGPEEGRHDLPDPFAGGLGHGRLADHVGQSQPVEDPQGLVALGREEGKVRDQAGPGHDPGLPVRDRSPPGVHWMVAAGASGARRSLPQSVPCPAVVAASWAASFLPVGAALGDCAGRLELTKASASPRAISWRM